MPVHTQSMLKPLYYSLAISISFCTDLSRVATEPWLMHIQRTEVSSAYQFGIYMLKEPTSASSIVQSIVIVYI